MKKLFQKHLQLTSLSKINIWAKLVLIIACLALVTNLAAQDLKPIPELRSAVTDQVGWLQPNQAAQLENRLRIFSEQTGSQIALLIVDTTAPDAIEGYSIRVFDQWKLGRAKIDDGILILIASQDRALRIEVGRGLEGAIPDAIAKRIGDQVIMPYFKKGAFFEGITLGINTLEALIKGENLPAAAQSALRGRKSSGDQILPIIAAALAAAQFIYSIFGMFGALVAGVGATALGMLFGLGLGISVALGIGFSLVTLFLGLVLPNFSRGGFYGGGRYRGGFSGGGFGGFSGGGGGASGGGATSRW